MNKLLSTPIARIVILFFSTLFYLGNAADAATANAAPGKKVTLSVTAGAGTAPFTYQWKKDNVAINGATSSTYVIPNVQSQNAGAYTVVVSNAAGSTTSDIGTLMIISTICDFNGDGKADILWQNSSTGERSIWLMSGSTYLNSINLGVMDPQWSIVGTADFNRDGKTDMLLQNVGTGQRIIWIMNGQYVAQGIDLGYLDPVWSIVGVSDFNGDAIPDILLENTSTGQRVLWIMSGPNAEYVSLGIDMGYLPPVWHIAGIGDFNADGKPDIVLENSSSGQRVLWLMTGPNSEYVSLGLDLGLLDPAWHIVGCGDFSGDGGPDILLENVVSGQHVLWIMYGPNNAYVQLSLDQGIINNTWHFAN